MPRIRSLPWLLAGWQGMVGCLPDPHLAVFPLHWLLVSPNIILGFS